LREFNSYQNFQWDDGTGPANYSLNRTNKNDLTVFVNYRLTSDWKTHLEVTNSSFNFINSEIYDSVAVQQGATVGSSPYSNTQASQNIFKWTNVYKLMNKNTLNFGYEYSTQNLVSSGQMNRNTSAFYAGYLQKIGSLDFQLNGRHDQVAVGGSDFLTNSQYYSVNTGLLGLGYWLTDSFRLTATESSGFSAPAIQQLAWNQSYANWNLLPQNVKSSEVGAEYVGSVGSFRGVRFNSTTTNYIDFQTTTGCTSTYGCYVNDPLVYNQGWEFTGRINYQGYKIVAAYTSQNPIDATTGEQQARRAKQFGSMDVDKAFGDNQRYDAGVKWVFSGSRLDNYCVNNSTCTLSAYQLWSFYAGMKLNDEFKVRFRIDNAFNENYQLAYGYNTPGTTAWLTLIYQEK
jgi:vitamin B12 transporter